MVQKSDNHTDKKIKEVADVAVSQVVEAPRITQTQTDLTGTTPNYREDGEGAAENRAGVPSEFLHLFELDPSEIILVQALRHPFGTYVIYTVVAFVVALVMAIAGDRKSVV